jgi:hypothetical protein
MYLPEKEYSKFRAPHSLTCLCTKNKFLYFCTFALFNNYKEGGLNSYPPSPQKKNPVPHVEQNPFRPSVFSYLPVLFLLALHYLFPSVFLVLFFFSLIYYVSFFLSSILCIPSPIGGGGWSLPSYEIQQYQPFIY